MFRVSHMYLFVFYWGIKKETSKFPRQQNRSLLHEGCWWQRRWHLFTFNVRGTRWKIFTLACSRQPWISPPPPNLYYCWLSLDPLRYSEVCMYGSHDILNYLVTKHFLQHWMHHSYGLFLRIAHRLLTGKMLSCFHRKSIRDILQMCFQFRKNIMWANTNQKGWKLVCILDVFF